MTYPLKFRQHVLSVRTEERLTIKETAKRFKVGVATLTRWIRKIDPIATRKRPWIKIDIVELARDIRAHPDAYLYERAERLGVSRSGVKTRSFWLFLKFRDSHRIPDLLETAHDTQ